MRINGKKASNEASGVYKASHALDTSEWRRLTRDGCCVVHLLGTWVYAAPVTV